MHRDEDMLGLRWEEMCEGMKQWKQVFSHWKKNLVTFFSFQNHKEIT